MSCCGAVSRLANLAMRLSDNYLVITTRGTRSIEPGHWREQTLKVVLSALWNLSAQCRRNKMDICEEPGFLVLLMELLRSSSIVVVENGGGILRNISSFIATCQQGEDFR